MIATMQVEGEAISRFGVIDAEEIEKRFQDPRMVEKPAYADAPSDLAIIGRYIFTPISLRRSKGQTRCRRRDPDHRRNAEITKGAAVLCREVGGAASRRR